MKKLTALALSLAATLAVSAPAMAQTTAISAEAELGGVFAGSQPDTTVVRAIVSHRFASNVVAEVEGQSTVDGAGLDGAFARAGYQIGFAGVTFTPSVEAGYHRFNVPAFNRELTTVGLGAAATIPVAKSAALTGTYRYRTDLDGAYTQHEFSAGGRLNVTDNLRLNARYIHRVTNNVDSNGVALGLGFQF